MFFTPMNTIVAIIEERQSRLQQEAELQKLAVRERQLRSRGPILGRLIAKPAVEVSTNEAA